MAFWDIEPEAQETPKPTTPAEKLGHAIFDNDAQTALKLLEDAGGACQARKLAKEAGELRFRNEPSYELIPSLGLAQDKETLTLIHKSFHNAYPVVSIEQPRCKE